MASLICRWCRNSNVKALGENTQCFDCGRLAENTLVYAPEPEVVEEPDQTPEEAEEAAALAAEIEAEEAAAAEKKTIPGLTTTSSLSTASDEDDVVTAPLPANSPLSRAKKRA